MTKTDDRARPQRRITEEQTAAMRRLFKALHRLDAFAPRALAEVEEVRAAVENFVAVHYHSAKRN